MTAQPVIKYMGAKWSIADWIVDHMQAHEAYVEPFFGSGAVLFTKARSRAELVNDVDDRIVSFFRVLRERPEELARVLALTPYARSELNAARGGRPADELEMARRLAVECWQMRGGARRAAWRFDLHGGANQALAQTYAGLPARVAAAAERLRGVAIECRPALEVLELARERGRHTLIYADPPYLPGTRGDRLYAHEMTRADHVALLDALDRHPGPVLLSAYPSPLYTERLEGWTSVTRLVRNQKNQVRTEVLWLNRAIVRGQMSLRLAEVSA